MTGVGRNWATLAEREKHLAGPGVWVANLRTGQRRFLSTGDEFSGFQVRPGGGNWLTCSRSNQTWSLNVADGSLRQLTAGTPHTWPQWSPDGQQLVVTRIQIGLEPGGYLMLQDSTGRRIPAPALEACTGPAGPWSPDGHWLLQVGTPTASGQGVNLYNFSTGQVRFIAAPSSPGFQGTAWLPDSQEFVWCSSAGVFRTALRTGTTIQLRVGCASRIYNRPSVAGDGRLVVVERTDQHVERDSIHIYSETNLWAMSLDGSNERKLVFRPVPKRK